MQLLSVDKNMLFEIHNIDYLILHTDRGTTSIRERSAHMSTENADLSSAVCGFYILKSLFPTSTVVTFAHAVDANFETDAPSFTLHLLLLLKKFW